MTSSIVSVVILIITVAISLHALYNNKSIIHSWALHPYSINRKKNIYTLLSSIFVHASIEHLLFNMFTFFFFAFALENVFVSIMGFAGHILFLFLYIISAILADITTIIKNKNNPRYYSLGASGAISAVLFSYILFFPTSKISLMFIPIGIPAYIFGPLYLAYCIYASKKMADNINHDAHFYGALSGVIITLMLFPEVITRYF